jgi:hypothetical protein
MLAPNPTQRVYFSPPSNCLTRLAAVWQRSVNPAMSGLPFIVIFAALAPPSRVGECLDTV